MPFSLVTSLAARPRVVVGRAILNAEFSASGFSDTSLFRVLQRILLLSMVAGRHWL
jgi:hypothetical protein